ncbi:LOW QUALITY PROTEIN: hypothetical protein PHMEG_00015727 [Phytophthora megakarya]|uniref:PiggyBac transposable element-derived protein domain-containing protein n=1 Tax=Phytophthora megakarya TaxID=4795 RepID=A0A225W2N9_9STRA|nr:LOW QUALITY PROTEIN: hypothetical protein PHMEG_00015727 [Phytophthora megakarya]
MLSPPSDDSVDDEEDEDVTVNMMGAGAYYCTGLNSDENPEIREELEGEDDADDDTWDSDWEIGELSDEELDEDTESFPDSIWSTPANKKFISSMCHNGWEYDETKFGPDPAYADLFDGATGPSDSVLTVADAHCPKCGPSSLWRVINTTRKLFLFARAISVRSSGGMEIFIKIRARFVGAWKPIEPWEILRVVALLRARMLVPIRENCSTWVREDGGSLPANRFGKFMTKNRFFHVMRYLHFSNHKSPPARLDRIWNIRPVVDVLQCTFSRGYKPSPVISFDEATFRFNPILQFNMDKPHTWGTMVFVACDAESAYCMRIEVYCGAKKPLQPSVPEDNNYGEAVVLLNMNALLPPSQKSPWRLVITDRFYTSVKLALALLHRRMYITGTIGRAVTSKKYKTVNTQKVMVPPQGTVKLAQNKKFQQITAVMWMDRYQSTCSQVVKADDWLQWELPAPGLIKDYHKWMGGVDVQDLLRMQRYSIQLGCKSRLLDIALVNAFIVRRYYRKANNRGPTKHFAFFEELMEQLLTPRKLLTK